MSEIRVSDDPAQLDVDLVYGFLSREAYWSRGIDRATFDRSVRHSLCFGAYTGGRQVGFARVITDRATFAYLCDVFVVPAARGRGVARALLATIAAHEELQGLRRFALVTRDAHGVYERAGFSALAHPQRWMERLFADVHGAAR
jgi:GNAT superfamily N-acetyltransferase